MVIDSKLLERIKVIDWFENCGKTINSKTDTPIIYAHSWGEAKGFYEQPDWENVTLDASNDLSQFLYDNFRDLYKNWNNLAEIVRIFIDSEVMPKIKAVSENYNLGQIFIDCVTWDISHAIMEDAYKQCDHSQTFFRDLLNVYESGHFPCGWDGNYPNGSLIVY